MRSAAKATFVQVAVALLLVAALVWLAQSAPFLGAVETTENVVHRWGALGVAIYPILVAAATVLFLPGGVLSLGGGFFFGLWWGTLLVLVGNLLGAAAAFWIGQRLGRRFVREKILCDNGAVPASFSSASSTRCFRPASSIISTASPKSDFGHA
jgi:uncharacterized membrane protein YdjX (TVP38/TMEM64 family)